MRARGQVTTVITVVGVALLVGGCKKTVEGENKSWQRNQQQAQTLSAQYPAFGNAIKQQLKQAEDAMAAAKGVSNAEESAKKMADANSLLSSGFVYTLGQLDDRTRRLREKLVTASTEAEHASDAAGAKAAVDDAQRILRNVDDALKTGAPDATAASAVLRKIEGDLQSATANLDRVIDAAKARKAEAAKAAAPAAGAAGAVGSAAAAPAAPVMWKCSYCNHMNADTRTKCENCGAPRAAPKAPPAKPTPKKK